MFVKLRQMKDEQVAQKAIATTASGPVQFERFLDCVHCGLCTAACPTYLETGDENNGPRGRIHLMRAVQEERIPLDESVSQHLDLCLDCRACETACPSGVQYGRIIEPFRVAHGHSTSWLADRVLNDLFPHKRRLAVALAFARLSQRTGIDHLMRKSGLMRLAPALLQRMHRVLPPLPARGASHPEVATPTISKRGTVGLFLGCVADAMYRPMHHATRRVLLATGHEVVTPATQGCCGAISYHGSAPTSAIEFIERNLAAFDVHALDAIVVNVAGCGALLKELPEISRELAPENEALHKRCDQFSAKVRDISEVIYPVLQSDAFHGDAKTVFREQKQTVVYHAACHLNHAQKIREQPLGLLEKIPGLTVLCPDELDICCGAAGSYNLTQPEMAGRLGKRKVDRLLAANGGQPPDAIVSANVGCTLHLSAEFRERGIEVPFRHPIELLDEAFANSEPSVS